MDFTTKTSKIENSTTSLRSFVKNNKWHSEFSVPSFADGQSNSINLPLLGGGPPDSANQLTMPVFGGGPPTSTHQQSMPMLGDAQFNKMDQHTMNPAPVNQGAMPVFGGGPQFSMNHRNMPVFGWANWIVGDISLVFVRFETVIVRLKIE